MPAPSATQVRLDVLAHDIEEMKEGYKETNDTLNDLCTQVAVMRDNLSRLARALEGNGHPGLGSDVADIKSKLSVHLEESKKRRQEARQVAAEKRSLLQKAAHTVFQMVVDNIGAIILAIILWKIGLFSP